MSGTSRKEVQTTSTIEAIRMASASVLGSTTGLGYPIGSAMGTGSMLEQNSQTVSMNVAPLIFTIRDTMISSEGLELLAIEWDLERTPGPGVLPEQLVVAGGTEGGVGSHVCVLSWERGVVDPFKIDSYVKNLSKKIGDIETAIINNEMNYELEGLAVMQKFADRLNSVLFVDMIDRRFQGSWDSFQIKTDHVDVDVVAKMDVYDDFTILPPTMKIKNRRSLDFKVPPSGASVEYFKHRFLTQSAIEVLTKVIPETGRDILSELNMYAYAMEEADVAAAVIKILKEYLQRDSISLSELNSLKGKINEFVNYLDETVESLDFLVEKHLSSGKNFDVEGHKTALLDDIESNVDRFSGIKKTLANEIVDCFIQSLERESIGSEDIRAWQLKGTLSYAVAYSKKVTQYFSKELDQYLVVSAAREAFFSALREFRQGTLTDGMESTDTMLFEKFYAEVQSQLNAAFSKKSYAGTVYSDYTHLMDIITREMIDTFKRIDVWNLIGFSDVAEIARSEIQQKYSVPQPDGPLNENGRAIMEILDNFQSTVEDVIPNVADTILSKQFIRKMIEQADSEGTTLVSELAKAVENAGEKSEAWKKEARSWVEGFEESSDSSKSNSETLLELLEFVHEVLGQAVSATSMSDRVKSEADAREAIYKAEFAVWESECKEIESENECIRQRKQNHENLIADATRQFETETARYSQALREYQEKMEQRKAAIDSAIPDETGYVPQPPPAPLEPERPSPLEPLIETINRNHPVEQEKSFPPEPQPEPTLHYYVELRDLIYDKLSKMKERETVMEETFARQILRLQSEGIGAVDTINLNIGDDFLEYLMESRIRGLGRLLPRISRVYLRDPKNSELLYLVTYEYYADSLTVSIGSTFLR
ncbi:MAG: hypothetical protein E4H14_02125 [Candidatus Thorarchaeota archaeon]|nr:MAG: hypothetical protein E4H14_02125 [Candidatus Thorarchaeota archaeon]